MTLKRSIAIAAIGGSLVLGLSACGSSNSDPVEPSAIPALGSPSATAAPSATASPSIAPEPSATASNPTATADEMAGAPKIEVAKGGYFNMPEPSGWLAAMTSGKHTYAELEYSGKYDPNIVQPVTFDRNASEPTDVVSIKGVNNDAALWQVNADAPAGPTNILLSYVDPTSGETKTSTLIVTVK